MMNKKSLNVTVAGKLSPIMAIDFENLVEKANVTKSEFIRHLVSEAVNHEAKNGKNGR